MSRKPRVFKKGRLWLVAWPPLPVIAGFFDWRSAIEYATNPGGWWRT